MKMNMKLKTWQKNVLSATVIVVGGFILWNAAFMLAAGVNRLYALVAGLLSGKENVPEIGMAWIYVYLAVVLLISWFVFRAKRFIAMIKATYLAMPLMVVLILMGIQLYQQPKWVPISIGGVIVLVVLGFLYLKKLPWHYYFATVYTAAMALYVVLAGIEI
jgi:hypothetical protein